MGLGVIVIVIVIVMELVAACIEEPEKEIQGCYGYNCTGYDSMAELQACNAHGQKKTDTNSHSGKKGNDHKEYQKS
ncbi:MAG: hypothetical protein U5L00_19125 [Desulfovermiculus sp.]|nr:hypothetical protein [Desulfovermiculus sp.]